MFEVSTRLYIRPVVFLKNVSQTLEILRMAKQSLESVDFPPAKKVKISENRLFKESWKNGNSC